MAIEWKAGNQAIIRVTMVYDESVGPLRVCTIDGFNHIIAVPEACLEEPSFHTNYPDITEVIDHEHGRF